MRPILAALCVLAAGTPLLAAADSVDPVVAEAIRRADDALARADAGRDVAAAMEVYAEDAVLFPGGEEPAYGKAAVRRWMTRRASSRKIAREQIETASLDACGDLAVETGSIAAEEEAPGGTLATRRTPRIAVWKRQSDGSWKIGKEMWGGAASFASPVAAPAGAPAAPVPSAASALPAAPSPAAPVPPAASAAVPEPVRVAPPADVIPIPDPRGLSDGFVRTVGDRLRSRAAKIRSVRAAGGTGEALRAAISRADRDLQATIRDVGWIDVARFGLAVSCDAAFIVAESGDPALVRSAVPWMKDLESNPEGAACYQPALEAYRRLK